MLPLVHEAANAGVIRRAGVDEVEAGRTPWLELPAEDSLVEFAGAVDVVDVDGEGGEVVWHGDDRNLLALLSQSRYSDNECRERDIPRGMSRTSLSARCAPRCRTVT